MHEKDNYLKTAELSTEQNCNMIDGVPNNTPIPPTPPEYVYKRQSLTGGAPASTTLTAAFRSSFPSSTTEAARAAGTT